MASEGQIRVPVVNNEANQRFEVALGDKWAFLDYRWDGDELALTHTEVPDGYRGQGVGSDLVAAALQYARRGEHKVNPECPFVAAFIRRNPEYTELIGPGHQSDFELEKSA
jgi:predicted GNAT family acetyltransferase